VFAALGIQLAMRTPRTVICDLTGSTIFFYINSSMARVLKNVTEYNMCVMILLQFWSETFLTPRRSERVMIKNVHRSSCRVTVILVWLYLNLNFLSKFSQKIK